MPHEEVNRNFKQTFSILRRQIIPILQPLFRKSPPYYENICWSKMDVFKGKQEGSKPFKYNILATARFNNSLQANKFLGLFSPLKNITIFHANVPILNCRQTLSFFKSKENL